MVKLIKTGNLTQSGQIEFNGKILKVGVIVNKPMDNVRIKITSFLDEIVIDDHLEGNKTVFYPRTAVDLSQEQTVLDYHYIAGKLNIYIEGLAENEQIDDILIYFE